MWSNQFKLEFAQLAINLKSQIDGSNFQRNARESLPTRKLTEQERGKEREREREREKVRDSET